MSRRSGCAAAFLVALFVVAPRARAQQTIFNVPSADVLERGEVYGELDLTARPVAFVFTATPRVVAGLGGNVEVGLNAGPFAAPGPSGAVLSPTFKWRPVQSKSGWSVVVGDTLYFPVAHRQYDAGNQVYAFLAKQWRRGTRVAAGGYEFTPGVVAGGHRAGGLFTVEHPVTQRVTLAAEWYTGRHAAGYLDVGGVVKLARRLTLYACYQLGNTRLSAGNHNLLVEVGYRFR